MYVCMYVCMYVYMYACMCVCIYLCMYVCVYVCTYSCVVILISIFKLSTYISSRVPSSSCKFRDLSIRFYVLMTHVKAFHLFSYDRLFDPLKPEYNCYGIGSPIFHKSWSHLKIVGEIRVTGM